MIRVPEMVSPASPASLSKLGAPPQTLARTLLAWYRVAKRRLPWRGTRDPYGIWVSEVMLQQTQASVVGPYYRRFLQRFPDVEALATADVPEVLELWSGLGYYSRARNLHAAAQSIAAQGGFPKTLEGLRALPGFGAYTAAAVGSIAFGLREPAIDGNALRVYARLTGLREPRPRAERTLRELAQPLMQAGAPGDLNQALMDLGQLVCRPIAPDCASCPWRRTCVARREGTVSEIPLRTKAVPRRALVEAVARIERRGALLLARRREQGLFGGLWELPAASVPSVGTKPASQAALRSRLRRMLRQELGLEATVGRELASVDRTLTHRNLRLVAFDVDAEAKVPRVAGERYLEAGFFSRARIESLGVSSASRKLLSSLW